MRSLIFSCIFLIGSLNPLLAQQRFEVKCDPTPTVVGGRMSDRNIFTSFMCNLSAPNTMKCEFWRAGITSKILNGKAICHMDLAYPPWDREFQKINDKTWRFIQPLTPSQLGTRTELLICDDDGNWVYQSTEPSSPEQKSRIAPPIDLKCDLMTVGANAFDKKN